MCPRDLEFAPREWAERLYNVQQDSTPLHGGHFPGWDEPDAYAADLRQIARALQVP